MNLNTIFCIHETGWPVLCLNILVTVSFVDPIPNPVSVITVYSSDLEYCISLSVYS